MNLDFLNTLNLDNKIIYYKELKVKHLKIIYKCLIGDKPASTIVIYNFNNIIKELTDLSLENIKNISIIDYFLILLQLRCTSVGDTIFAELTDEVNTKIEINVNKFIKILNEVNYSELLAQDLIDNVCIIYKLPSVLECIEINKKENFDNIHRFFIKKIVYNNLVINFSELDNITCQKVLESLPAKLTATIVKKAYKIIEYFNQINLLSTTPALKDKFLAFNFNIDNFIFLSKLLFGDQLMSLYDNIFLLSKRSNFSPDYIENCTPGEYYLYLKKLEMLTPQQKTNEIDISENSIPDPFSDIPPITSRSEFTP